MMLSTVGLIIVIVACCALVIAILCRKRAEIRRRHFIGRLEKALAGSTEIHS
jgi:hypothetical protein